MEKSMYHCGAWLFLKKNSLMVIVIVVAMLIWFNTYISCCTEDSSLRHMPWGIYMAPSSLFGDAWTIYDSSWGLVLFSTWSKHVAYKSILVLFVKLKRNKKKKKYINDNAQLQSNLHLSLTTFTQKQHAQNQTWQTRSSKSLSLAAQEMNW